MNCEFKPLVLRSLIFFFSSFGRWLGSFFGCWFMQHWYRFGGIFCPAPAPSTTTTTTSPARVRSSWPFEITLGTFSFFGCKITRQFWRIFPPFIFFFCIGSLSEDFLCLTNLSNIYLNGQLPSLLSTEYLAVLGRQHHTPLRPSKYLPCYSLPWQPVPQSFPEQLVPKKLIQEEVGGGPARSGIRYTVYIFIFSKLLIKIM